MLSVCTQVSSPGPWQQELSSSCSSPSPAVPLQAPKHFGTLEAGAEVFWELLVEEEEEVSAVTVLIAVEVTSAWH